MQPVNIRPVPIRNRAAIFLTFNLLSRHYISVFPCRDSK